jgi:O-Antigen ligase
MTFDLSDTVKNRLQQTWLMLFVAAFYVLPVDVAKPVWYVLLGLGTIWAVTKSTDLRTILIKQDPSLLVLLLLALLRGLIPDASPDGGQAIYTKHFSNLFLLLMFYLSLHIAFNTLTQRLLLFSVLIFATLGLGLNLIAILADQSGLQTQIVTRAVHLGRMRDPNMYGVSLGLAFLSGLWLFYETKGLTKYATAFAVVLLLAGMIYTQSRGAVIALGMPVLFLIINHFRPQRHLFLWAMLNLGFISALVGFEDLIAKTLCQWIALPRCTSSARFEIWVWTYDLLKEFPLLGVGAGFRFPQEGQSSPHHILWGTALYFGIPIMLAFLAMLYRITKDVEPHAPLLSAFLILGCGFMATNLAQPFAFINWHYLFLWLPVFFYASPLTLQQRFVAKDPSHRA